MAHFKSSPTCSGTLTMRRHKELMPRYILCSAYFTTTFDSTLHLLKEESNFYLFFSDVKYSCNNHSSHYPSKHSVVSSRANYHDQVQTVSTYKFLSTLSQPRDAPANEMLTWKVTTIHVTNKSLEYTMRMHWFTPSKEKYPQEDSRHFPCL